MTTQPKQNAIVSQRDREIAADIWRDYVAKVGEIIAERCMREGGLDDGLPSIVATYRAEIEAATIERCVGVAEVAEEFAKSLAKSDFANVGSALNSRMCCNGSMCGCQGATVGQYLAFELRAVIKRCAVVVPTDVVARVCAARQIMDKGYVSTAIADERPDAEALDAALEPFASRVCYDDDGGDLPEAHADPCTCGALRNLKGQTS